MNQPPDESSSIAHLYQRATQQPLTIGDRSIIRSWSSIYSGCELGAAVDIGHAALLRENVHVGDYAYLFPAIQVKPGARIGHGCRVAGTLCDNATLEPYVNCLGHLVHSYRSGVGKGIEPSPLVRTGATIGREAIVVGAVEIGEFALVAANATVTKDVEAYTIVAGSPAKRIGIRSEADLSEIRHRIALGERL